GGENYIVEATTNRNGSVANAFGRISPLIAAPPAAVSLTNYLDTGAGSNTPGRFYRIRLGP
ncbi:MAG TPA: hypothetical protein VNT26_01815, partial [Candidatus Sulfotelmatobacter sp.]|nr:hypothetical protein [Candidatus Sulfotelmatobacter sp.]